MRKNKACKSPTLAPGNCGGAWSQPFGFGQVARRCSRRCDNSRTPASGCGDAAPARPAPDGFLDGISSARLGFAAQAEGGGRCAAGSSAHLSHLSRFPGAGAGAGSGWRPGLRPGAVDPSAGVAPRGRLWVGPGDWAGMEPRSPMLGPHRLSLRPGRHSDPRPVVEF